MKLKIENKQLKATLFCLFIYATIIVDIFRIANNAFLHMGDGVTTMFRNAFYIFLFLLLLLSFVKDKGSQNKFVILCFIYAVAVLVTFIVNSEIELLIRNNVLMFFSRIAPGFIIADAVDDYNRVFKQVTKWRWLVLVYIVLFVSVGMSSARYYYLYVGYNLLFPTLILLFANEKQQALDKMVAIAAILVILLFCARGTALVLIPAVVLFYAVQVFRIGNTYKKFIVIGIMILIGVLLLVFLDDIFEYLYKLFPGSRTLFYIMNGNIMNSSGRDSYYSAGIEELLDHPFKVRGILGDRYFYGQRLGIQDFEGAFAHNVILEVMLQFGVVIGLVLSIAFMIVIVKACIYGLKMNNTAITITICAIIIPSFLISMTTASYLSSIETAFMMGICTSLIRQYKCKHGGI